MLKDPKYCFYDSYFNNEIYEDKSNMNINYMA